jgi:aspartyl protease family protein
MKQIIFFAIAAMLIAGIMPRVMSQVGNASTETQPVKRAAPAPAPQPQGGYRTATLRADARGHFQVEGAVDGRRLDFMVDTGATVIALRERDAGKLGIFPTPRDYTGRSSTANGIVKVAPVRLPSLEVNGIRVYDVAAVVIPDESLSVNLLGMSFLSRVRRFEMANGRLVMEQ